MNVDFSTVNNLKKTINENNVNILLTQGGTSMLMQMSMMGLIDNVKYLLSIKADVNFKAPYGWTALMFATINQHFDIVKLLIEAGADINAQTTPNSGGEWNAIMFACKNQNKDIINYLLNNGAGLMYDN